MPNVKVALLLALYGSFDTMATSSKQTLAPARQGKAWQGISPTNIDTRVPLLVPCDILVKMVVYHIGSKVKV